MALHRSILTALAAAALLPAPPLVAAPPPDRLAETLALPVAGWLTGAAGAPRFAWVETAAGVRNIWIADRGTAPRKLTDFAEDDGLELYDLALTADGRTIAYVHGGDEEFPDGEIPNSDASALPPKQEVFVAPADGGAAAVIGSGHSPTFSPDGRRVAFTHKGEIWLWQAGAAARKIAAVAGDVSRLSWSPDGKRLLFADTRDDHGFVGLLDLDGSHVRYLDPSLGFSVEPTFSPDGGHVAFVRYVDPPAGAAPDSGPYWSIRIADAATGETRVLWSAPTGAGARFAGTRGTNLYWSKGGKIVFPWERSGWLHPYAIDADTPAAPRELTPGAFEVETYGLAPDGRSLVYAANAGDIDRRHIWRVSLAGGAPERVTGGEGIESYPVFGGDTLAVTASDATHPAYPALAGKHLAPLRAPVEAAGFITPEQVILTAEDGVTVHGQLFRARGPGRHPALIFVHGGPRRQMMLGFHPSGYYSNAYILNQHFAAEGYDVLSVNYRSGTGYGMAFRDAPAIARDGASEYRDVLAAGRWLAAQPTVDPARVGIWGGSWGGYLTALALARNSDIFAAGVDFHGVHTMLRPVPNNLSPAAQEKARALQWSSSPMGAIDTWRSPVLLIHGDDDKNVDFFQSLLLARELAARRIPFRELTFPNERHGFLRYADWLASYRAADAFFDRTLKQKQSLP